MKGVILLYYSNTPQQAHEGLTKVLSTILSLFLKTLKLEGDRNLVRMSAYYSTTSRLYTLTPILTKDSV